MYSFEISFVLSSLCLKSCAYVCAYVDICIARFIAFHCFALAFVFPYVYVHVASVDRALLHSIMWPEYITKSFIRFTI